MEADWANATERAEELFREMKDRFLAGDESMRPDCISYSILLNAYAADMKFAKAEDMLWEMVDDYLDGNETAKPRIRTFHRRVSGSSDSSSSPHHPTLLLFTGNFNTVLAMYSKSKSKTAPKRAEQVLARFRDLHNRGDLDIQPDAFTYGLLLKSWVNSDREDGIHQAVSCLYWMRDLSNAGDEAARPDIVKYTSKSERSIDAISFTPRVLTCFS
jgi:hypothetical protein